MNSYIKVSTICAVFVILALDIGLSISTTGCSKSSSTDPVVLEAISDPNLAAGKAIFEKNCIGCHPYGKDGVGPNLSKQKLTAEAVKKQVRKGGLIMPSFSEAKISNDSLDQLAVFVPALNKNK